MLYNKAQITVGILLIGLNSFMLLGTWKYTIFYFYITLHISSESNDIINISKVYLKISKKLQMYISIAYNKIIILIPHTKMFIHVMVLFHICQDSKWYKIKTCSRCAIVLLKFQLNYREIYLSLGVRMREEKNIANSSSFYTFILFYWENHYIIWEKSKMNASFYTKKAKIQFNVFKRILHSTWG